MARKSTGEVLEREGKRGTAFVLRFRALGKRQFVTVGNTADGWTRERAEQELQNVLADVRRGLWQPPTVEATPEPQQAPTFHVFATEWFEGRRVEGGRRGQGLTPAGEADLRWQLEVHLLPTFARKRLDEITVEDVDRFRRAKVAAGKLNATSINKCLTTLASVLELAVEYGHVGRNVAKGKRRRLPSVTPPRTYIDRADGIAALLAAAGELDREREQRTPPYRRALVAVLTLAGLRIDEALSLRWRHVDLGAGVIHVPGTKTHAAARDVDLLPLLRDELVSWVPTDRDAKALVFGTKTGQKQGPSNVRRRVLTPAVERANVHLAKADAPPLREGLTPHSLRRTFASILVARGEDPAYVMAQMGHTTPHLTLALYAQAMQRRDGERERLRALVDGGQWEQMGANAPTAVPAAA